ncbi:hypothetical protein REPUB_Repub17cG0089800 [Reevesia pubescens]
MFASSRENDNGEPGLNWPRSARYYKNSLSLASWLSSDPNIANENNLGSDDPLKNPVRNVSSFIMQLKYAQGLESIETKPSHRVGSHLNMGRISDFEDDGFDDLKNMFKALGFCMIELGLCLARICDRAPYTLSFNGK